MPKYAVLADHSPDICPGSNARTRASAFEGLSPENVAKAASDLGLTFVVEPLHLDPSHRTVAIVDAPSIETVNEFVMTVGLMQWNTIETCAVTPIAEMMEKATELDPLF
jgi:hypothetical protein